MIKSILSILLLAGTGLAQPQPLAAKGHVSRKTSKYTIGPSVQPMIIIGEGWSQQFTFANVDYYQGGDPTVGTLYFYSRDGKPWRVPLAGRGLVDHVDINLAPGQMLMLETEVSWAAQTLGWAYFDLSDNTNLWGIYHSFTTYRKQTPGRPDLMTSVPFVDGLEDNWVIPFDNSDGKYPGIGVVNASTYSRTTFVFEVCDVEGKPIKEFVKTVDPMHLEWFSLVEENPDLVGKRGQIRVTGGLWASSVLTLQFTQNGAFTALPLVHTFGMQ